MQLEMQGSEQDTSHADDAAEMADPAYPSNMGFMLMQGHRRWSLAGNMYCWNMVQDNMWQIHSSCTCKRAASAGN